jgi:UDP-N-acetyl-D-glucosamine dehydrogenase
MKTVGVIGQGYVGLTLAVTIAESNLKVFGFDIDQQVLNCLSAGESHIEDISNERLLRVLKTKNYSPTGNFLLLEKCDVIIIAVPTPLNPNRVPDLNYLYNAVDSILKNVQSSKLIINESTSFPGTLRTEIAGRIESKSKIKHRYAVATERIDPGNTEWNIRNTPRVLGVLDLDSLEEVKNFYSIFSDYVFNCTSAEVAEFSKLIENSFRLINIALVNDLSKVIRKFGLSIYEVLDAAATKPYGFMKFKPGAGVGGHCIPVDPLYLTYKADEVGISQDLIKSADKVNRGMPSYILDLICQDLGEDLADKKILLIGVSYKPNISDTRESPANDFLSLLESRGSKVFWHDKLVPIWNNSKSTEIFDQDIAIIITAHEYLDKNLFKNIKYIFDCTGKFAGDKNIKCL